MEPAKSFTDMSIEEILRIALEAHTGQKDLDGNPAILHPLAVGLMNTGSSMSRFVLRFFPAEPAGSSVRSTKRTWKPQASSWSANMISPVSVPQGARARRR